MSVAATLLTAGGTGSATTSIATASVTPPANELILVWIVTDNGAPTSLTGNGLTYVEEDLDTALVPMAVWRSMGGAPSAGAITINLGANSVLSWIVVAYSGVDTSGSNGAGAIVSAQDTAGNASGVTALTLTLPGAVGAGNAVAAAMANNQLQAMTAGAGYSKLGEDTANGFVDWAHEWRADGTTTPSMSWASSGTGLGLAVEIKAAAGGGADSPVAGPFAARGPGRISPTGLWTPSRGVDSTTYQQTLAGTVTPAGALTRQTDKVLGGTVTPAGALLRSVAKALAGTITPAGSLIRQTAKAAAGTITPAGALQRSTAKILAGTATPAGALQKLTAKTLGGTVTPAGALASTKVILLALAGTITPTGALSRLADKVLGGTITPAGAVTRSTAKTLGGAASPAGALAKTVAKTYAGTIGPAATLATVHFPGGAVVRDLVIRASLLPGAWRTALAQAGWRVGRPGRGWRAGPPKH